MAEQDRDQKSGVTIRVTNTGFLGLSLGYVGLETSHPGIPPKANPADT